MTTEERDRIIESFRKALFRPGMSSTAIFAVGLTYLSRLRNVHSLMEMIRSFNKEELEELTHRKPLERSCMITLMTLARERGNENLSSLNTFADNLEAARLTDDDRKELIYAIANIWYECGASASTPIQAMLPVDVTRIAIWLVKKYVSGGDIYNPYAGIAQFGVELGNSFTYLGHEPNPYLHMIGKINLALNNLFRETAFYFNCEPLKAWTQMHPHVTIMTPPWGVVEPLNGTYSDVTALLLGAESMDDNGVLLTVMPTGAVKFADKNRQPWNHLITQRNMVECVISMPRHVFSNSVSASTMLLLRKNRKPTDPIKMLTAAALCDKKSELARLRSADIIKAFEEKDPKHYIEVSPQELAKMNYVLSPEYHIALREQRPGRRTVRLRDIANLIEPKSPDQNTLPPTVESVALIETEDLYTHPYKEPLDPATHRRRLKREQLGSHLMLLDSKVLMMSVSGALSPTVCDASREHPAVVDRNSMLVIEPVEGLADIDFLAYELSIARKIRNSINLTPEELGHLVLYIPEKPEEQHQIFAESKRATQDTILRDNDLEARTNEKVNEFKLLERTRRHNISTYIANTTLGYLYTQSALQSLSELTVDSELMTQRMVAQMNGGNNLSREELCQRLCEAQERQEQIKRHVDEIRQHIGSMQDQFCIIRDMVKRFGSDDAFGEAVPVSLDRMLIQKDIDPHGNYTLELKKDDVAFSNKEVFIKTSEFDFLQLYDNIVNNACRHGFAERDSQMNKIRISWHPTEDNRMVEILFENNGAPLPDGIDKESYGREGGKAGKYANTGHGGNYVKNFTEHFNGSYDVIRNSTDAEFCTAIKIIMPIEKTQ